VSFIFAQMASGKIIDLLEQVCDLITKEHNMSQGQIARMKTRLDQIDGVLTRVSPARFAEVEHKIEDMMGEDAPPITEEEWSGHIENDSPQQLRAWLLSKSNRSLRGVPIEGWGMLLGKMGLRNFQSFFNERTLRIDGVPTFDDSDIENMKLAGDDQLTAMIQHLPAAFLYYMPPAAIQVIEERGLIDVLNNHGAEVGCQSNYWVEQRDRWSQSHTFTPPPAQPQRPATREPPPPVAPADNAQTIPDDLTPPIPDAWDSGTFEEAAAQPVDFLDA
jgi:hypothetical protein